MKNIRPGGPEESLGPRAAFSVMRDAASGDAPPYLWCRTRRGSEFSGSISRLARKPPIDIDVVQHVLREEAAGTHTAEHFMRDMTRQLLRLLPQHPPVAPDDVSPDLLASLFRAAARQSGREGGKLLVLVDRLELDPAWRDAAAGISVASLLPGNLDAVRVIVTCRPVAQLPDDVPDDHPLRRPESVRFLALRREAHDLEHTVPCELEWLNTSPIGRTLVGLFSVAGGGLRFADAADTAGVELPAVEGLLADSVGGWLVPDATGSDSYLPLNNPLPLEQDVRDRCVGLLHAWADSWQARGWPDGTPRYLLSHYPGLLRGSARLAQIVLDPHRQARLAAEGRIDEALAQLELVAGSQDDPHTSAQLAVSRALLTLRTRPVPRYIPRLLALAGDVERARTLALSAPQVAARAVRLADVAQVLRQSGHPQAEEVAREAAELAAHATASLPLPGQIDEHLDGLAEAGIALYGAGLDEAAHAFLRTVVTCDALGWPSWFRAVGKPSAENADWLPHVMAYADVRSGREPDEQAEALEIWGELVALRGEHRASVCERVEQLCADLTPSEDVSHIDLLALGALALMPVYPKKARPLAERARDALRSVLESAGRRSAADRAHLGLELSDTLARVVAVSPGSAPQLIAAVPEECVDILGESMRAPAEHVVKQNAEEADERKRSLPGKRPKPLLTAEEIEFRDVRKELAGDHAAGHRSIVDILARWEGHAPVAGIRGWGLSLAWALAVTGPGERAALLADRSREPSELAGSLAVVSLGCALGGRLGEARAHAARAAAVGPATAPVSALISQAFAYTGDVEEAKRWCVEGDLETRAAIAMGFVPHSPDAAAQLVSERLAAIRSGPSFLRQRRLPKAAEILLAVPDARRPTADLRAALGACSLEGDLSRCTEQAVLLHALLDASGHYPEVPAFGRNLALWETAMRAPRADGEFPAAEWAVLQAFRGDVPAALETARRAATPGARAGALAAVASYLARVPVVVPAVDGWLHQPAPLLRYLALADALGGDGGDGGDGRRDEGEARRILGELLSGEHWAHALPLLPRLAPEVVPLLGELALVHTDPC